MSKFQGGTFGHTKHPIWLLQNWFAHGCVKGLLCLCDLKKSFKSSQLAQTTTLGAWHCLCKVQGGLFGHTRHPIWSLQNWFARGCSESLLRLRDFKKSVQKPPTCADHNSRSLAPACARFREVLLGTQSIPYGCAKTGLPGAALGQLEKSVQKQPTCADHNSRSLAPPCASFREGLLGTQSIRFARGCAKVCCAWAT